LSVSTTDGWRRRLLFTFIETQLCNVAGLFVAGLFFITRRSINWCMADYIENNYLFNTSLSEVWFGGITIYIIWFDVIANIPYVRPLFHLSQPRRGSLQLNGNKITYN
jgi:hypothetical protein